MHEYFLQYHYPNSYNHFAPPFWTLLIAPDAYSHECSESLFT
ncbi:hypothetical protein [Endozoicomonas sp.]